MCGIVGYIGKRKAAPILLESLSRLEYRGYDSAGLCVRDGLSTPVVAKERGRLKELSNAIDGGNTIAGTCGIGHTRWATHGAPSVTNAHPHMSSNSQKEDESNVIGVHNGIIENYQELKAKLSRHGYTFYSETDTEVAIKLIDYYYRKYDRDIIHAVAKSMIRVRGSFAFELMFKDRPNEIWVARKDSPLIIGVKDGESYIASDVPAILKYTRSVYYVDNYEFAKIEEGKVTFYNLDGDEVTKELVEITWDNESAEKGGYEHFMLKEIHEQPKAIRDTLNSVLDNDHISLAKTGLTEDEIKSINSITIVACGSAWHTGMVAQYVFESLAKIPVRCELASEFRYRHPILNKDQLVIVVSQSGETADSLAALRLAKDNGVKTLGIVNVVGSSIAREADHVFYTLAGPEIAVATTKAYSAQLIALYCLAINFASIRLGIDDMQYIESLKKIPEQIEYILDNAQIAQWYAIRQLANNKIFFVGRGIDYATCLEGSLKMKEISYIHSEAYAAGELKHGTISLVEEGTLVLGCLTQPEVYEKTLSNMIECKARGATISAVAFESMRDKHMDFGVAYLPDTNPLFAASLAVVPFQLLGYYVAVARGNDVDKPRNLAKSVTVE